MRTEDTPAVPQTFRFNPYEQVILRMDLLSYVGYITKWEDRENSPARELIIHLIDEPVTQREIENALEMATNIQLVVDSLVDAENWTHVPYPETMSEHFERITDRLSVVRRMLKASLTAFA